MKQLGVVEFGQELLRTGDLDPIYILLHHSGFTSDQLQRWCVAYWLFYNAGVASLASEQEERFFWGLLSDGLTKYPRGRERRHFRGKNALNAIRKLESWYPSPESFVEYLKSPEIPAYGGAGGACLGAPEGFIPLPFEMVLKRSLVHPQFGPWISFKVADMLERVLGVPIDFSKCDLLDWYEEPRKGAELVARQLGHNDPKRVLLHLREIFCNVKAPPAYDRYINIQEIETLLCKYKAHLNGHYPVGNDCREILHSLQGFDCDSAKKLQSILLQKCDLTLRKTLV